MAQQLYIALARPSVYCIRFIDEVVRWAYFVVAVECCRLLFVSRVPSRQKGEDIAVSLYAVVPAAVVDGCMYIPTQIRCLYQQPALFSSSPLLPKFPPSIQHAQMFP